MTHLVVLGEEAVGDRDHGRAADNIDQTVFTTSEVAMVDPDALG